MAVTRPSFSRSTGGSKIAPFKDSQDRATRLAKQKKIVDVTAGKLKGASSSTKAVIKSALNREKAKLSKMKGMKFPMSIQGKANTRKSTKMSRANTNQFNPMGRA